MSYQAIAANLGPGLRRGDPLLLGRMRHFAAPPTSRSQRSSRRLRSAAEPYLAKLYSMSLISAGFGDRGETGVLTFDGSWNDEFDLYDSLRDAGVGAQSYTFLRVARCFPAL